MAWVLGFYALATAPWLVAIYYWTKHPPVI